MKRILALLPLLLPLPALAGTPTPLGPNGGHFGAWTAATYGTGAGKICYAFAKPQSSKPALPGRGLAMLTVTERAGSRDEVSITPGFTYPKKAKVSLAIGKTSVPFYIEDGTAFTNGQTAAIAGFANGSTASVTTTGAKKPVVDVFSLAGFSAAYKTITHACP